MNPLSTFTFKLIFNNENSFGEVPISESVKFDGATYIVEQENGRFGRDVAFLNDTVSLFFYKGVYDVAENPMVLPSGTIINNLTQGFEYLIEVYKIHGFEMDVSYIIE